jgi:triacylglycerol lipase
MAESKEVKEHVIVLHGLALNRWWTAGLAESLKRAGYEVHNVSYPSRRRSFEALVDIFLKPLVDSIPGEKVHFAVHSMGGLLVRLYAKKYGVGRIGRVVMLGTPNKGSEVADFLRGLGLFKWYFGATGINLGTAAECLPGSLGPVGFECGVIAGTNHWFHFPTSFVARLPRPCDGIVSVESTRVDGMKAHVTCWADHSLMVWHPAVWKLTASFLREGRF